jgi:Uma2 family endonuclease
MDTIIDRMAAPSWAARKIFDVTDYHRMASAGVFAETGRYELIEGEIIEMAAIGGPHIWAVIALHRLLFLAAADRFVISVQNSLRLGNLSEPEPDIAVLRPRGSRNDIDTPPSIADVALVVEVADTSLQYDRAVKGPLYAGYGVPEYWIVDLTAAAIEVHRNLENGAYASIARLGLSEHVEPACLPGTRILVADVISR